MPRNRLNLNFQLESADDRAQFVNDYMRDIDFTPTAAELETISNYILWGKNASGKNAQQEGNITLKEWAARPIESLENLIETPGFVETSFKSMKEPPMRTPRIVFNRTKALECAPAYLQDTYKSLFRSIDEIELMLNYYELFCGKRKLPPRENLLNRFTEEEQQHLNEKALRFSQYKYLKLKHLLKELREEQWSYSDFYQNKVMPHIVSVPHDQEENTIYIGEDISVLPAGLVNQSPISSKLFNTARFPCPSDFNEKELCEISKILNNAARKLVIDFRIPEHILQIYNEQVNLYDMSIEDPYGIYNSSMALIQTLQFYEDRANLSDLQKDILSQKLRKIPNFDIARDINQKYNKSYNENYISTIFHQKIIPLIAEAAQQHYEILENIFYPENFKKCKDCGQVLLMTTQNFVKQKKSKDGFSPRCKVCEKIKREKYK